VARDSNLGRFQQVVHGLARRTIRATGNSFAAPHITGLVARLLSKHPGLTPFQVKTVLHSLATNAYPGPP
jgi:subtilisin family serine protease